MRQSPLDREKTMAFHLSGRSWTCRLRCRARPAEVRLLGTDGPPYQKDAGIARLFGNAQSSLIARSKEDRQAAYCSLD